MQTTINSYKIWQIVGKNNFSLLSKQYNCYIKKKQLNLHIA